MKVNKDILKDKNIKYIDNIISKLANLNSLELNSLDSNKTTLIIIDVINGFVREGALKSERIENIINPIVDVMKKCKDKNIDIIAFGDSHNEDSPEFESYPLHCLENSSEVEVVDEIKNEGGYKLINKNSTNGFLESEFQSWLKENENITNFIVTGDCTDICILQFSLSIKTFFNLRNIKSRIIVPINSVETFDNEFHHGDLMNIFALEMMDSNGIELVKEIK